MSQHLDIALNRRWRVTVVTSDIREERVVSDEQLGAVIETVASRGALVEHVECVPVYSCVRVYNFAFYGDDQSGTYPGHSARAAA